MLLYYGSGVFPCTVGKYLHVHTLITLFLVGKMSCVFTLSLSTGPLRKKLWLQTVINMLVHFARSGTLYIWVV